MEPSVLITAQNLMQSAEVHFMDIKHNYRYERKFTVPTNYSMLQIERTIKANSFFFREVYHERQVNNIYFDTAGYNDYFDNVLGVANRRKIRIRWYGETLGHIEKPVLEIKTKKGLVGDKWSFKLQPFTMDNEISHEKLQQLFKASDLPLPILESTRMVFPTLLNSYSRRYFLSADGEFRITLDYDLIYRRIESKMNNFSRLPKRDPNKIVELKYSLENDSRANAISTQFPFRLNKNSKYVNGVNALKRFPQ